MKKIIKILLPVLILVILLAAAVAGYRFLSERYDTSGNATDEKNTGETVSSDPSGDADAQETAQSSPSEAADDTTGEESEDPDTFYAPDFTMTDENGAQVRLSDFFDRPVILNFWATWCGPCQEEMPHFDTVYAAYQDRIHFLMVNLGEKSGDTVEKVQAFLSEKGFQFPVLFDSAEEGAYAYGVNSIPLTLFIRRGGMISDYQFGILSEEDLYEKIDQLLK